MPVSTWVFYLLRLQLLTELKGLKEEKNFRLVFFY